MGNRPDAGRNAQHRIQSRKGETREEAELDVGQLEFLPYRLEQDAHQLLVEKIERRQGGEKDQQVTSAHGEVAQRVTGKLASSGGPCARPPLRERGPTGRPYEYFN
jgi:hypothetical protein